MTTYSEDLLLKAFNSSKKNYAIISDSKKCGCFMCGSVFPTKRIKQWQNAKEEMVAPTTKGASAVCPNCESATVVGDAVGVTMTPDFLEKLVNFAMPMIAASYKPIKERTEQELSLELEAQILREATEAEEEGSDQDGLWDCDN